MRIVRIIVTVMNIRSPENSKNAARMQNTGCFLSAGTCIFR